MDNMINSLEKLKEEVMEVAKNTKQPADIRAKLISIKQRYLGEEPIWVEAFLSDTINGRIPISFFKKKMDEVIIVIQQYKL